MSLSNASARPSGEIARLTPAKSAERRAADQVLEQMFGYFSYEPMPGEKPLAQAA